MRDRDDGVLYGGLLRLVLSFSWILCHIFWDSSEGCAWSPLDVFVHVLTVGKTVCIVSPPQLKQLKVICSADFRIIVILLCGAFVQFAGDNCLVAFQFEWFVMVGQARGLCFTGLLQ